MLLTGTGWIWLGNWWFIWLFESKSWFCYANKLWFPGGIFLGKQHGNIFYSKLVQQFEVVFGGCWTGCIIGWIGWFTGSTIGWTTGWIGTGACMTGFFT